MTLHSYWPVILVGCSSIRKRYLVVVNYLQSVPGTRVTECYITMSPSTGVVLNVHVGTGRCVCRACSSSVFVMYRDGRSVKNVKSVVQRPYWEANCFSATHYTLHILWNPEVHHSIHNSPPLVAVLSQVNPLYTSLSSSLRSILILSAKDRGRWRVLVNAVMNFCVP